MVLDDSKKRLEKHPIYQSLFEGFSDALVAIDDVFGDKNSSKPAKMDGCVDGPAPVGDTVRSQVVSCDLSGDVPEDSIGVQFWYITDGGAIWCAIEKNNNRVCTRGVYFPQENAIRLPTSLGEYPVVKVEGECTDTVEKAYTDLLHSKIDMRPTVARAEVVDMSIIESDFKGECVRLWVEVGGREPLTLFVQPWRSEGSSIVYLAWKRDQSKGKYGYLSAGTIWFDQSDISYSAGAHLLTAPIVDEKALEQLKGVINTISPSASSTEVRDVTNVKQSPHPDAPSQRYSN